MISGVARAQVPAAPGASEPAASSPAVDPSTVVLKVGDEAITAGQFAEFLNELPPQVQMMTQQPSGRRMIAEQLVKMKLMAQEAKKRKLDEQPKVQKKLELLKDQVLAQALAENVQSGLDEASVNDYFKSHQDEFSETKARHILIRTPGSPVPADKSQPELTEAQAQAKADEVYKRVSGGEDFATVAKAESADRGSAVQGGELSAYTKGQMVKPFEEAAAKLKINEISPPVRSQFGWHIIQLQARTTPSAGEIKGDLKDRVAQAKLEETIEKARSQSKPMLDESYFGPAPATEPAGSN